MIILPVPPPPDSILYSGFLREKQMPAPSSGAARRLPPAGGRLLLRHVFRKQEMCLQQKGLLHQMPCSSPLYHYKENLSVRREMF